MGAMKQTGLEEIRRKYERDANALRLNVSLAVLAALAFGAVFGLWLSHTINKWLYGGLVR